jgi:hypothetical protein
MTTAVVCVVFTPFATLADHIDNEGIVSVYVPQPEDEGSATITEYTDFLTWSTAVGGPLDENRYADLGGGVTVTTQYLSVGALYTDGDDVTQWYGNSTDGFVLNANGRVNITFSRLLTAIGVNFPGALRIVGYLGNNVVFVSSDFGGGGAFIFGGIISTQQFDRVELIDWLDDTVFLDDVFYNAGGPVSVEDSGWGRVKGRYYKE